MEGSSSTARVAAAALVKNTGVAEADVVPGGGSSRGAVASGGGLVLKAADVEEHGFGGATVPDLNVQPVAEDPLVVETSSAASDRKRKYYQLDDEVSDESAHSYFFAEISFGDAVSYKSASSDASSDGEVSKYNVALYEKKIEEKIWEEGLDAYLNKDLKYYCKFHPNKQVPRDGSRKGLVTHAKTVKPKDLRDKANHATLIKRTLEMFNKEGVTYKPAAATVSSNMVDEEDVNSFQNGLRDKKEFMYKEESDSEGGRARVCSIIEITSLPEEGEEHDTHVKEPTENGTAMNANDAMRTLAKASGLNGRTLEKTFGDGTPDNPFIIDNVDPVTSDSEIDIDAVTISKFISKAKEDELVGKRKRTIPKKNQSPYALDRRTKRQVRGSSTKALNFDDKPGPDKNPKPDASTDLTPELVDAAIVFLELASRSEQHKKNVYQSAMGDEVNAERLRVVLDERWLSDDVIDGYIGHLALRVGHDCFLCPAWRSKYLVYQANAGDKPQDSSKNMDSAIVRSGVVGRVVAEYTVRDKVYFHLNIGYTRWMTVVMHIPKQEFQVLDSLYPLEFTLETIQALRRQIGQDMQVANEMTGGNHLDVTKWPILEYDMPQQQDGNSCGLFVIECMEHWDGDRMTAEISQIKVNARQRRVVTEMMLSPSNTLEIVKQRIWTIASKINKKT
ncbi:hypothetical protein ACQ4PT_067973 [Festuca glaucescens]